MDKLKFESAIFLSWCRSGVIKLGKEFRDNDAGTDDAKGVGNEVEDIATAAPSGTVFLKDFYESGHEDRKNKVAEEMFNAETIVGGSV